MKICSTGVQLSMYLRLTVHFDHFWNLPDLLVVKRSPGGKDERRKFQFPLACVSIIVQAIAEPSWKQFCYNNTQVLQDLLKLTPVLLRSLMKMMKRDSWVKRSSEKQCGFEYNYINHLKSSCVLIR